MPFDPRIVPGAWVVTRFGKAICVAVEAHDHSCEERRPEPGVIIHPCEDDTCRDAMFITYRYRATRHVDRKEIWVANGDLSGGKKEQVKFLRSPTTFTARVRKLEGPYGEGKLACGPGIYGYCACGEPYHD